MIEEEINIVRQTWSKITTDQDIGFAQEFYHRLFENCPHLKDVFKSDHHDRGIEFMQNINHMILQLDNPCLVREMQILGIKYASYGIKYEDYECIKKALFQALKTKLSDQWTPTVMVAWVWFYSTVSHIIKHAGYTRCA